MNLISTAFELLKGLSVNVLITIVSSILPIIVGIIFVIASKRFKGARIVGRILGALSEAHVPMLLLTAVFHLLGRHLYGEFVTIVVSIFVFVICFMGYIPARFNENYSAFKNIAVNTIGLISSVFKWSFCVRLIAVSDMFGVASWVVARTYRADAIIVAAVIAFVIVLLLEGIKMVLEKILK